MYKLLAIMAVAAITASLDLISILTFAGYVLEADAKGVAFIAVAMFLPLAVLGKFYGQLVQRVAARDLMLVSLGLRGVATGLMFFVSDVPSLVLLVLFRSAAIGLFYPTVAALAEQFQKHGKFAAWTNFTNSGARVLAPLVGGVLGVLVGEKYVFVASAAACILVLPLVFSLQSATAQADEQMAKPQRENSRIDVRTWLLMGLPIVGVSGLSVMMSNLMPYTLNLFEVPKITLSIALSLSAATGLLTNLAFVRWGKKPEGFPSNMVGLSWIGVCLGFVGLAAVVQTSLAFLLIPLLFTVLTLAKTCFTVSILGYVFQQPKNKAAQLAAFDQSLGSMAGMVTTLVGAFSLVGPSPIPMMFVAASLGGGVFFMWWVLVGRANRLALAASS